MTSVTQDADHYHQRHHDDQSHNTTTTHHSSSSHREKERYESHRADKHHDDHRSDRTADKSIHRSDRDADRDRTSDRHKHSRKDRRDDDDDDNDDDREIRRDHRDDNDRDPRRGDRHKRSDHNGHRERGGDVAHYRDRDRDYHKLDREPKHCNDNEEDGWRTRGSEKHRSRHDNRHERTHHYDSNRFENRNEHTRKDDRKDVKNEKKHKKDLKKKSKKLLKSTHSIINEDEHLLTLTPSLINTKLLHANPLRIEHSSFLVKYNPLFLKAQRMARTNFLTLEERKALQDAAKRKAKAIIDATSLQSGFDGDGDDDLLKDFNAVSNPTNNTNTNNRNFSDSKSNPLSQLELDAMREAVKKRPNYFTTELLRTVGGGSMYQGANTMVYSEIPGQGATNQLPMDFTNLHKPLKVETFDMSALQKRQQAEHIPMGKLMSDSVKMMQLYKNKIGPAGVDTQNDLTEKQQQQIKLAQDLQSQQTNLTLSRYQEPSDTVIPKGFTYPSNVTRTTQWYLYIYDKSWSLFEQFFSSFLENPGQQTNKRLLLSEPIWYNPLTQQLDDGTLAYPYQMKIEDIERLGLDGEVKVELTKKEVVGQQESIKQDADSHSSSLYYQHQVKPTSSCVDISNLFILNHPESQQHPNKPLAIKLAKGCYKLGSNDFINDITLPHVPFSIKERPLISLKPELAELMQDNDTLTIQVNTIVSKLTIKINTIWDEIIALNQSSILNLHAFLQFRLRPTTLDCNPTTANPSTTITIPVPTPYLFIPTPPQTTTLSQTAGRTIRPDLQCYFREISAQSRTGFIKSAIPTNRFVEVQDKDVVVLGNALYEMVFIAMKEANVAGNKPRGFD